jgi:hypothetical protein
VAVFHEQLTVKLIERFPLSNLSLVNMMTIYFCTQSVLRLLTVLANRNMAAVFSYLDIIFTLPNISEFCEVRLGVSVV